jgi:hypothetical protein
MQVSSVNAAAICFGVCTNPKGSEVLVANQKAPESTANPGFSPKQVEAVVANLVAVVIQSYTPPSSQTTVPDVETWLKTTLGTQDGDNDQEKSELRVGGHLPPVVASDYSISLGEPTINEDDLPPITAQEWAKRKGIVNPTAGVSVSVNRRGQQDQPAPPLLPPVGVTAKELTRSSFVSGGKPVPTVNLGHSVANSLFPDPRIAITAIQEELGTSMTVKTDSDFERVVNMLPPKLVATVAQIRTTAEKLSQQGIEPDVVSTAIVAAVSEAEPSLEPTLKGIHARLESLIETSTQPSRVPITTQSWWLESPLLNQVKKLPPVAAAQMVEIRPRLSKSVFEAIPPMNVSPFLVDAGGNQVPQEKMQQRASVSPQDVVLKVADRLIEMISSRKSETLTLQLDPPELGSLMLTIKADGNKVDAHMLTANPDVRAMVESNRDAILQALADKGLELASFFVGAESSKHARQDTATHSMVRPPWISPLVVDTKTVPISARGYSNNGLDFIA